MSSILDPSNPVGRKHLGGSASEYVTSNKSFNFPGPSFSIASTKSPNAYCSSYHTLLLSWLCYIFSEETLDEVCKSNRSITQRASVRTCRICKRIASTRAFLFPYNVWGAQLYTLFWPQRNSCLRFSPDILGLIYIWFPAARDQVTSPDCPSKGSVFQRLCSSFIWTPIHLATHCPPLAISVFSPAQLLCWKDLQFFISLFSHLT